MKRRTSSKKKVFPLIPLGIIVLGVIGTILVSQTKMGLQQYAAGDLYVSASGSDANSGTQSSPFKTIQKGVDSASAGTTVHVAPGNYGTITISKSGTASSPLTIISDTKWGAKISGSGNGTTKNYLVRNNGSYVRLIGFDMTGKGVTNGVDNFGSHNLIQGNHVHDMTNINCSGTPGGSGLGDDTGSNNTYDGNIVNNFGDYPTKCDYVHAIYVDDDGDIVSNNITYNNVGNGLYTNHGTGKVIFTNNLSYANKEYGLGINGSGSGNIAQNNILIGNGIAGMKTWSGVSNTQVSSNILFNNASNFIFDGSATQSKTITSDPQLVNYQSNGSGDYHLKAGSPAIGAGVSGNAPSIDFDGHSRSGAIDIGPYAYGSTGGGLTPTITSGTGTSTTPNPSTTGTPSSGVVKFSVSALLHALGKGGDNVTPGGTGGNMSPIHTQRNTTISLTGSTSTGLNQKGTITYNSTNGNFTGDIQMTNVPNGQYTVNIKTDGFLSKTASGIVTINTNITPTPGVISVVTPQAITLPSVSETTGDVNNDNQIDILDYNMIVSCYGSKASTSGCTAPITTTSPGADINDDGAINGIDYNFFIRELSKQSGN
ncbi:MAG TPA: choice-of-anchor Q domain-containing protein [Candidatus Saccharimonadales bacterium]|nr:choice-of-anchor Q domain-containing protein [Candidatus Saccharimonadales bacterium]